MQDVNHEDQEMRKQLGSTEVKNRMESISSGRCSEVTHTRAHYLSVCLSFSLSGGAVSITTLSPAPSRKGVQ